MIPLASKRRRLSHNLEALNGPSKNGDVESVVRGSTAKTASNDGVKQKGAGQPSEMMRTSGLSKSIFFKLQTDELLTELRPNYDKQASRAHDLLCNLKSVIERIPDQQPKLLLEAEREIRSIHGIAVPFPFPRPAKNIKYSVAYSKPLNINIVGSFALRNGIRTPEPSTVDVVVTMPGHLFQQKDYMNYRYFYKRAYYVACVAAGIQEDKGLDLMVNFHLQDGDGLRPIINLEPNNCNSGLARSKLRVRIITAIEETIFPISKTLPLRNNLSQGVPTNSPAVVAYDPISFYNCTLRSEATVATYHKYLNVIAQRFEFYKDACILGRAWLRQRGFRTSVHGGGFGGFEWAVLVALLFEGGGHVGKPILLPSYSSYQIFKSVMQFLAGTDLTNPLMFYASDLSFPCDVPVIYDGRSGMNILYKMTPWAYDALLHESKLTLTMLNDLHFDNFDKVFGANINNPISRFDHVISLSVSNHTEGILQFLRLQWAIHRVLSKALGSRIRLMSVSSSDVQPWSLNSHIPSFNTDGNILIGLLLDAENASSFIDYGPSTEQKDAAASFREFWGPKAELRRFKDGQVLESLVWSDQQPTPSVLHQILIYVLHRHLKITEPSVRFIGEEYDEKLCHQGGLLSISSGPFQLILKAFQSLEKSLQSLGGIPLSCRQLAPASPLLRYTALKVESEAGIPSEPVEVVLQLESSARWPDDLAAIQLMKVVFLIKIGDLLESSGSALSSRVGQENESHPIFNNAFLDVVHPSRIAFRLRIHHDREQIILERKLKEKGISACMKEETASALAAYRQLFIQGPRLTQAIQNLCTCFHFLSPTIRLVKHWFNTHFMRPHISDELLELFTVHTFVRPHPWEVPSSVMSGFLRTLYFLSRWGWQKEPLVIDFGGLNSQQLSVIETRFIAWRRVDPEMKTVALMVSSNIDQDGVTWTLNEKPPKVVAARISSLAKAAMKLLKEKGINLDINDLFKPSLEPFDFLIEFQKSERGQNKSLSSEAILSFLQEVQTCYDGVMLLFHGGKECNIVGGLWKPQEKEPKQLSLKMAYSTHSEIFDAKKGNKDEVVINKTSILNEIARMGGSMIHRIQVHNIK
ncbi:Nrap protein [Elaphomyces granulatus]